MSLKEKILTEGMRLFSVPQGIAELTQNPHVTKLLADERFMRLMVMAMSVPGRVSTFSAEQRERFAKEMGLATSDEVRDLKRQIGALEDALHRLERKSK